MDFIKPKENTISLRGVFRGGFKGPPFFEKIFQFARVFHEKNAKTPPKFTRLYKKNLKPLPQKISGYAPDIAHNCSAFGSSQRYCTLILLLY